MLRNPVCGDDDIYYDNTDIGEMDMTDVGIGRLSHGDIESFPYHGQYGDNEQYYNCHGNQDEKWNFDHEQQQNYYNEMEKHVSPRHLFMDYGSYPVNVKVPMAPARYIPTETQRPNVTLVLPFYYTSTNRRIPQTFTRNPGMVPHYSPEEIQNGKNLFIKKYTELDFGNITVVELKNFLKEFNLASGGKKDDLILRIKQVYEYLINEGGEQFQNQAATNFFFYRDMCDGGKQGIQY